MESSTNEPGPVAQAPSFEFRGLLMHAWDFHDEGLEPVLDEARASGLNTLCVAGTYHSGWFIHPHSPKRRAFMTEGSVCYFHPNEASYKNTRLKPKVASFARDTDWFAAASKKLGDLRLVSWTVGTHNTRLGLLFPELTQQNVYGDSLPHALCPAQPEVQEYLYGICRDLATQYPLWGLQLEAFGWMGLVHGHHHERDLAGLTGFEQELMGWCVCPACAKLATAVGVEMEPVKLAIRHTLDGAFREAPLRPPRHPRSVEELSAEAPEIAKYCAWRKQFADSIIRDIKLKTLKGTSCRVIVETDFDPALADVVDGFSCASYQHGPARTLEICRKSASAVPASWKGLHQCLVQLGMGIPESEGQLREIVDAVKAGGCNGINFYNRSESPRKMLDWMAKVMTG